MVVSNVVPERDMPQQKMRVNDDAMDDGVPATAFRAA